MSTNAVGGLDRGRIWGLSGAAHESTEATMSKEKGRPGREKKKPKADKKSAPASASFLNPNSTSKPAPGKPAGK
jgi:hypothetical protein